MIRLDGGGVVAGIRGLDERMEARLRAEWALFVLEGEGAASIEVEVSAEPPTDDGRPFSAARTTASFHGAEARYAMEEGFAIVPGHGPARIQLRACGADVGFFAFLTLLGAILAWRAPSTRGLVLHAAGIVLDGRAFALAGAEGSGKTTFARLATEAGIPVLGDDLVVVRVADGGVEAVGSPLRSRPWSSTGRGNWPLAALLLPEHASAAALAPVPPIRARARLLASLPFVAEGMDGCPGLHETLDAVVARVPVRTLRFAPDGSFLELLRTFPS